MSKQWNEWKRGKSLSSAAEHNPFPSKRDSFNLLPLHYHCSKLSSDFTNCFGSLLWHAGKSSATFQIHFSPKWTCRCETNYCACHVCPFVCILGYAAIVCHTVCLAYWFVQMLLFSAVIFMCRRMCLWHRRMTSWVFYFKVFVIWKILDMPHLFKHTEKYIQTYTPHNGSGTASEVSPWEHVVHTNLHFNTYVHAS